MLERGIAVRQGIGFLRKELPTILATRTDALSPRMLRVFQTSASRCGMSVSPPVADLVRLTADIDPATQRIPSRHKPSPMHPARPLLEGEPRRLEPSFGLVDNLDVTERWTGDRDSDVPKPSARRALAHEPDLAIGRPSLCTL
jgi:hypothetical protein